MSNNYKQGGTGTLIKIAFRNIWRNLRRTVFCFTAVGLAVLILIIYSSLIKGMTKSFNDIAQIFELGHVKAVSAMYEEEIEYMPVQYPVADGKSWKELAASVKAVPGVAEVFPRIATVATLQESTVKHAVLWGINAADETKFHDFNMTNRDDGIIEGRYPAARANECIIGYHFAEKSGFRVGDSILLKTVSAQFSDRFWEPVITGIFNYDYFQMDEQYIIVDFSRLQQLLVMGEGTQQLVIYADNENLSGGIAVSVQNILGQDNVVTEWRDSYWVAVMGMVKPLYMVLFLIFMIVASFLIINTVVMIIHERIKEIGMMGCLGMTRREIVCVFFFESFFLAAIGALAGVILGGIISGIGSNFPLRIMDSMASEFADFPMNGAIFFEFNFGILLEAWIMGVVVASIFTLIPSLRSAYVEPVEALRR